MNISKIKLSKFKKINTVELDISPINVLVGGNNSGKSSVLQGIHFFICTAIARNEQGTTTFSSEHILFKPTNDFAILRHNMPYANFKSSERDGTLEISVLPQGDENQDTQIQNEVKYAIQIYKGRNAYNICCNTTGDAKLAQKILDTTKPFSVYVPGVAGIPISEEFRSPAIISRGMASGDANLYLRNVIYQLSSSGKKKELIEFARKIYPDIDIQVNFNNAKSRYIEVLISIDNHQMPLELCGTGVQQTLQIFSYVVLFRPALLLIDEPDAHLHPNKQRLLCNALMEIVEKTKTKIILATHSKHMLEALYEDANVIWLQKGTIKQQGACPYRLPILLDIGALDKYDGINNGVIKTIILTEDKNMDFFKKLLVYNDFDPNYFLLVPYQGCSNLQAALVLSEFFRELSADANIMVHCDRDFMTQEEVNKVEAKIKNKNAIPFVTDGSDIEAYFINHSHIAVLLNKPANDVDVWINELAQSNHNILLNDFINKRNEIKYSLSEDAQQIKPVTLCGTDIPLKAEYRKGKTMLKAIRGHLFKKWQTEIDITSKTDYLLINKLQEIKKLLH